MGHSFKLKNGSILLSTEAPGGIYNASQLKKIASLCDGEAVVVKATEDQRLALLVQPAMASTVAEELKSIGLGIRHYQDGLHQPVSCVGEMCEDHEQDALGSALDISAEIEGLMLTSPLKIGINGCAKCCVPCHTLDISIVGDTSGYRISLGGKNSQLPEIASFVADGVPPEEMPRLIRSIIDIYKQEAVANETLQEVIERDGPGKFIQALAPWSQDAAGGADPFASSPQEQTDTQAPEPEIDADLTMDDTPLDTDRLNEEHDFALAVADDNGLANELRDIPVDALGSDDAVTIPIDPPEDVDVPEISMHDIGLEEDLGQAAEDLMQATVVTPVLSDDAESLHETFDSPNELGDQLSGESMNSVDVDSKALDLEEVKIDAGDALRGAPKLEVVGDGLDAEEHMKQQVRAESEDAMEAALAAGIDAQKDLVDEDTSDAVRDEGVELMEAAQLSLLDSASETLIKDTDASDVPDSVISSEDHIEDSHEDDFDVHDHLPLSEVVATRRISPEIIKKTFTSPKSSWSIAGFDLDEHGSPVISWTNGAVMTITAEAVSHGVISVGGHEILVAARDGGLQVEVDGVKMFLPRAA
jgi:hypothetical protein